MRSPFKFLDAYTLKDSEVFFGRDKEITALYDMLFSTPFVLVYGLSGTGKTSLVQCGLAGKYEGPEWYPFFIRRNDDLNTALRTQLQAAVPPAYAHQPLHEIIAHIVEVHYSPVYLIFDQFEELFILGTKEEQEQFAKDLKTIMDAELSCNVILIIREEYLGSLYDLEQYLPTLFDFKLRVEMMRSRRAKMVLRKSFEKFNITLEEPQEDILDEIIQNVSGGKSGIELPYLQVYLDMLYREDYKKTYNEEKFEDSYPPLQFTKKDILAFGKIEDVLSKFLEEQVSKVEKRLFRDHKDLPADTVAKVLDSFVTSEGTKKPIPYTRENKTYKLYTAAHVWLSKVPENILSEICSHFVSARVLRGQEGSLELAHDSLAKLIDNKRTDHQRRLHEVYHRLNIQFQDYTETGEYLSRKQLNLLEDYLPQLKVLLDDKVLQFVDDSYTAVEQAEQAELQAERAKRKRARKVAIWGFLLAGIATAAFVVAAIQYNTANNAKIKIAQDALEIQMQNAENKKIEGFYEEAVQQLEDAKELAHVADKGQLPEIEKKTDQWEKLSVLIPKADGLAAKGQFRQALNLYAEALRLSPDKRLEELHKQTGEDLDNAYKEAINRAKSMENVRQFDLAIKAYKRALELQPDSVFIRGWIQRVEKRKN